MSFLPTRWQGEAQDALSLCPLNFHAGLPPPYTLQEVQVSIINNSRCNYLFQQPNFFYRIGEDMICAGSEDGSRDTCKVSAPAPVRAFLDPGTTGPLPTLGLRATAMTNPPLALINEKMIAALTYPSCKSFSFYTDCISFDAHVKFGG